MDAKELHEYIMFLDRENLLRKDFKNEDTMKLLCCTSCSDILSLTTKEERTCSCGKSSGIYLDEINAVFKGEHCIPLGISNPTFIKALQMTRIENKHQVEPTTCKGIDFTAFVILDCATSVIKE